MSGPPLAAPGPDISKAPLLVGFTTILHVILYPLFGARIWTRWKANGKLFLDDWFITLAVIFDTVSWICLLIAVHYGEGRHNFYVPDDDEMMAEMWMFISQPWYPWVLALTKMSIAWMLIRIQRDSKRWVWTMSFLMAVVFLTAISANTFQLQMAKPLSALWDKSQWPTAVFMPIEVAHTSIYVNSSFIIFTDIILSLAPISFIINIQRPLREKIVLCVVMALGLVASGASIAKTPLVKDYGKTGDTLMDSVPITIMSFLEMQLAIIACCIPSLKQLFEKVLRRLGLLTSRGATADSRSGYLRQSGFGYGRNSHHLSSRSRRDTKTLGMAVHHADTTDSLESGEMPIIMTPGGFSAKTESSVYFSTDIQSGAGKVGRTSTDRGMGRGIQKETTVSVRSTSRLGRELS